MFRNRVVLTGISVLALILGTLLYAVIVGVGNGGGAHTPHPRLDLEAGSLKWFTSYGELESYLEASDLLSRTLTGSGTRIVGEFAPKGMPAVEWGLVVSQQEGSGGTEYSETNVQVPGIDEADVVKTDGRYIYASTGDTVWIVSVHPSGDMAVEAKIKIGDNRRVAGLYVWSSRLVIISQSTYMYPRILLGTASEAEAVEPALKTPEPLTVVEVYDVVEEPVLEYNVTVSGRYFASRMTGGMLYVATMFDARLGDGNISVPVINGEPIPPSRIGYIADSLGTMYTVILSLDLESGEHYATALLTPPSSWFYMSKDSFYVLTYSPINATLLVEELGRLASEVNRSDPISILRMLAELNTLITRSRGWGDASTAIYKFEVKGLHVTPVASTRVPGRVLDQFAMDEHEGFFRVATTMGPWGNESNAIYVLDENLSLVGSLEGIGVGERIYSARFLGDLCFLVTYRRVDPLFAIDLSDPSNPVILGFLEMPGYSEYLHPVGEDMLLGIGYTDEGEVKATLFDVSKPSHPVKLDEIILARGWSPVMSDHKAFTLNTDKMYAAIPVQVYGWRSGSLESGSYIISIKEGGLELLGVAGHPRPQRTLYIGDTIYVFGDNLLESFAYPGLEKVSQLVLG